MEYFYLLNKYLQNSPVLKEINWFDLSAGTNILLKNYPSQIKCLGKLITIKRLISYFGKDNKINELIIGIKPAQNKDIFSIRLPMNLNNLDYIKLYALMISEGSFKTEFSLNVPENEFHILFKNSLNNLFPDFKIKLDTNNEIKRSRAPALIRYLLPFYDNLPKILFNDKSFAKEYLKIVFEAEGSPIFNLSKSKKYIKLSRNSDVTNFFMNKAELIEGKRLFINKIKDVYPEIFTKIMKHPNITLLGEHLLLKYHFDINSSIKLESICLNKVDNRCGKISAKWVLYIYAEEIDKFIREIGFISKNKIDICANMAKISSRRSRYFVLKIMEGIQKQKIFSAKDFMKKMRELGYKSPQKFLWDYHKNKKLIERIGKAKYKLLN